MDLPVPSLSSSSARALVAARRGPAAPLATSPAPSGPRAHAAAAAVQTQPNPGDDALDLQAAALGQRQAASLRPDAEAQALHAVATQVHLDHVVLPRPTAAPIDAVQAAALLRRLTASASVALALPGAPEAGDAAGRNDPNGYSDGASDPLADVQARLGLSPAVRQQLRALLERPAGEGDDNVATATATAPAARATTPARPTTLQFALGRAAAPTPGRATPLPTTTPRPAASAAPAPNAPPAAAAVANAAPHRPSPSTRYTGWTAFAARLTQQQQRALFSLVLLRLSEAQYASAVQSGHDALATSRSRQSVASGRTQATARLLASILGHREAEAAGEVSVLHNAELRLQRDAAVGWAQKDGAQAGVLQAELDALYAAAGARQRQGRAGGAGGAQADLPGPGDVLTHVPAAPGKPARQLQRLAWVAAERRNLTADERRRADLLHDQLRREEASDVVGPYARYSLSAQQLQAAARQTQAASDACGDPVRRQALQALANSYVVAAEAHADAAERAGFLQALPAVHRGTAANVSEGLRHGLQQRDGLLQRQRDLRDRLAAAHAAAAPDAGAALEGEGKALATQLRAAHLRLAGMAGALTASDEWRRHDAARHLATGTRAMVARAAAVVAAPGDAALQADFRAAFPAPIAAAAELSARCAAVLQAEPQLAATLADAAASAAAKRQARATLAGRLADPATYGADDAVLRAAATRQGLRRHVAAWARWDDANAAALRAQADFWGHHPELGQPKPSYVKRLRRGAQGLRDALAGTPRRRPRLGEAAAAPGGAGAGADAGEADAAAGAASLRRFVAPEHVDLLAPDALDAHLAAQAQNAAAWAEGHHDPALASWRGRARGARALADVSQQTGATFSELAEGSVGEVSAAMDEARGEALAGLGRAQQATAGLLQQLMQLHRGIG